MHIQLSKGYLLPLLIIMVIFAIDILCLTPATQAPAKDFPSFQTHTLQGQEADERLFAGHFNILCLWVTKDTTSTQLLEALSQWQKEENYAFQLVGLVGDIKDTDPAEKIAYAKDLTSHLPHSFPQLLANDSLSPFLTTITKAPTTFFINEAGQITGQPVIGHEISLIKKEARRLMAADSPQEKQKNRIHTQLFR